MSNIELFVPRDLKGAPDWAIRSFHLAQAIFAARVHYGAFLLCLYMSHETATFDQPISKAVVDYAKLTHCTERSVWKYIADAEKAGFVRRVRGDDGAVFLKLIVPSVDAMTEAA